MEWTENASNHGHVIVALNGEYIDLTLDQFPGYHDRIVAGPVESGRQIAGFIQKVRDQGGTLTTRERTFDGIPDQAWNLYAWLKEVADDLLATSGQGTWQHASAGLYGDPASVPRRNGCRSVRYGHSKM